jgi:cell wall-associated NlpC family hydrolase
VSAGAGSPALSLTEQESLLVAFERADRAYRPLHTSTTVALIPPDAAVAAAKAAATTAVKPVTHKPPAKKPPTTKPPAAKKPAKKLSTVAPPSGAAGTVVSYALAQVGKPYVYAASGPNAFDCSGLVMAAYKRVGINLPHQSESIAARGRKVPSGQWLPGDVIHTSGHVAIYIGGGKMVEAANPKSGVRIAPVRGGTAYRFL